MADGTFSLSGVPAGSRTLQISQTNGPPLSVALTVIPNAIVKTGEPPITRAAAVDQVKQVLTGQQILVGSGIWAAQQPLPAGVTVGSTLWFGDVKGPVLTTHSDQWIVYVDAEPALRFGHQVTCYLVDAETGALEKLESDSWPALNELPYYRPALEGEAASPDLVQAPPTRAVPLFLDGLRGVANNSLTRTGRDVTGKTYALLVRGTTTLDTLPDIEHVKGFFGTLPFPATGAVDVIDTPAMPAGTDSVAQLVEHFNALAAKTKPGDTFILYVSSHGILSRKEGSTGTDASSYDYFVPLEIASGRGGKLVPTALDFSKIDACNIVLMIDTCYSGMWISQLQQQLTGLSGKKIVILTATSYKNQGTDANTEPLTVGNKTVTLAKGGLYTSSLQSGLAGGATAPDLYAGLATAHTQASAITQAYWDRGAAQGDPVAVRLKGQFPQLWQRTLVDGEGCFGETVIIRSAGTKQ
jgi:hypothetical protein